MKLLALLTTCISITSAKLLLNYQASRQDDVSTLGILNLEQTSGNRQTSNTDDLYFKSGRDWQGNRAAHTHRKAGYIRSEYHSLSGKTSSGTTYWLGYTFALQQLPDNMIIFQWKEYEANNDADGGANIPLAMWVNARTLNFQFQAYANAKRVSQYSLPMDDHVIYTVGMQIYADPVRGTWKVWVNGKPVTFSTTKSTTVTGNMFPGRSEPKWGTYGGEIAVDSWIYDVQVGTSQGDLNGKYFG